MSGPVPMNPRTLPERFVLKGGTVRSTHEQFDEGICFIYVERGAYGFLIPTGKQDREGSPVFDDFIAFASRELATNWQRNAPTPEPPQPARPAAPRG